MKAPESERGAVWYKATKPTVLLGSWERSSCHGRLIGDRAAAEEEREGVWAVVRIQKCQVMFKMKYV